MATATSRCCSRDDERVYAFTRRHEGVELLVVANFSGETAVAHVPGWDSAELLLTNCPTPDAGRPPLTLQPWDARVYRR